MTFLLSAIGLAAAIIAWRAPRLAILWFPAILPIYVLRASFGPLPSTALELIFTGLAIGATIREPALWKDGWKKTKPWRWPVALWILATTIGIVVAPNHIAALGLWRAYILEPLVYAILLLGALKTEKDRSTIIRALILSAVVVFLWAIVQFTTGRWIPHPWDTVIAARRATGPFPFPNALALYCAPIAALCAGLLVTQDSKHETEDSQSSTIHFNLRRSTLLIGFLSATFATLLAKSAGGTIAILGAVSLILLIQKKTRIPTIITGLIASVVVFGIPQIRNPLIHLLTFKGWSGQVRLTIWHETWAMLKDHPIFGAGFGAYPDVIAAYHKATYLEIFQYPHDILLNFWSETGLLGIAAFGWICATWFRQIKIKDQKRTASSLKTFIYILPLVAILIHGLVDVPYLKNDLAMMFWIFAVLATQENLYTNLNNNDNQKQIQSPPHKNTI